MTGSEWVQKVQNRFRKGSRFRNGSRFRSGSNVQNGSRFRRRLSLL
jgi:hypothetical protein